MYGATAPTPTTQIGLRSGEKTPPPTSLVVAQRLVKRICKNCITEARVPPETLIELGVTEEELPGYNSLRRGEGCEICSGTGLKGRMAVFEVLNFSAVVKDAIFSNASTLEIKRRAMREDGMLSLRRAALLKLKYGQTSVEEVISGTVEDDL